MDAARRGSPDDTTTTGLSGSAAATLSSVALKVGHGDNSGDAYSLRAEEDGFLSVS
jgi:NAD(P)H-hydrate repair Nnr-like enzyme with NAD(P)H-hydrate epimerase domain